MVPEKGSSSLRENLKAKKADEKTEARVMTQKTVMVKKAMLPDDSALALEQLKVWAKGKVQMQLLRRLLPLRS
jgi:hypothetical protein